MENLLNMANSMIQPDMLSPRDSNWLRVLRESLGD